MSEDLGTAQDNPQVEEPETPTEETKEDKAVVDWKATLPEGVRDHPAIQNIKTVEDLAKSWVNVQKFIGREKLPKPKGGPDEDPETWSLIWDALGRPSSPDEYELPTVEIPEEIASEELEAEFRQKAHELGLLPHQVKELYEWYVNKNLEEFQSLAESIEEQRQEAEAQLRKEWGKAYNEKVELARKAFAAFADDDTWALFEEGLGNDPRIIKLFAKIGEQLAEDTLEGAPKRSLMSPEEARAEIARLQGDPKFMEAYSNKLHPEHQYAVERMRQLFEMAYPEEEK